MGLLLGEEAVLDLFVGSVCLGLQLLPCFDQVGDLLCGDAGITLCTGRPVFLQAFESGLDTDDFCIQVWQRGLGDLVSDIGDLLHEITVAGEAHSNHGSGPALNDATHCDATRHLHWGSVFQGLTRGDVCHFPEVQIVHLHDGIGDDLDAEAVEVVHGRSAAHVVVVVQPLLCLNIIQHRG